MIRAWQLDHDENAREALIRAYYRLCFSFAGRYSDNLEHQKDFAQVASMGMLRSLDKYDATRGVKFSTYSTYWIRNFINAMNADVLSIVTIPDRLFRDARLGKFKAGENDAAVAATQRPVLLDYVPDDEGQQAPVSFLQSSDPNPEEVLLQGDNERNFRNLVAQSMAALTDRERFIVLHRRLQDPPLTLNELSQHFGLTRERIRQIEKESLKKMKEALGGTAPFI